MDGILSCLKAHFECPVKFEWFVGFILPWSSLPHFHKWFHDSWSSFLKTSWEEFVNCDFRFLFSSASFMMHSMKEHSCHHYLSEAVSGKVLLLTPLPPSLCVKTETWRGDIDSRKEPLLEYVATWASLLTQWSESSPPKHDTHSEFLSFSFRL